MSKKEYKRKPKSKSSSTVGESKPKTPKPTTPDPQTPKPPQPWSSWEWSIEGNFYYRARKNDNDEWEYETSLPTKIPSTLPCCKETPRTFLSYYERPSLEIPLVENVLVVPATVDGNKEKSKGEAVGCEDVKAEERKKGKSKGLKKKYVDAWRNGVTYDIEELIIVEEEIEADRPREKKRKDKDKHHEKEYERKEWRRRPGRAK